MRDNQIVTLRAAATIIVPSIFVPLDQRLFRQACAVKSEDQRYEIATILHQVSVAKLQEKLQHITPNKSFTF